MTHTFPPRRSSDLQMGYRNKAASRVVGRISLFLESLVPNEEIGRLQAEERRLKARTDDLERKIGADDSGERLASTLNNISMHMSGYITALGGEFGQFPARLDQLGTASCRARGVSTGRSRWSPDH